MSMQMQANTLANRYGPGPNLALIYKKNALPRKTKTARMTVGPASMYWADWMASMLAL